MQDKPALRKIAKLLVIPVGSLLLAAMIATAYLLWSVSDIPNSVSQVRDCEPKPQTSNSHLVSNREWRVKATYTIEPQLDLYLAQLMLNRTRVYDGTKRDPLEQGALLLLLKISMNIEERVEQVLTLSYFEKGVTGLRCAAAFFFKKDTNELSIGQFALLVGMIESPSLYSPIKNPERAQKRRTKVIDVWLEEGLISQSEAKAAMNENLI